MSRYKKHTILTREEQLVELQCLITAVVAHGFPEYDKTLYDLSVTLINRAENLSNGIVCGILADKAKEAYDFVELHNDDSNDVPF